MLCFGTAYGFQPSSSHHDLVTAQIAAIEKKIYDLEQAIVHMNCDSVRKAYMEQLRENYQRENKQLRDRKILLEKLENTGLLLY